MKQRLFPAIGRPWNYRRTESGIISPVPYSLQFNGADEYLEIPNHSSINITGQQSWGIWCNLENINTYVQTLYGWRESGTTRYKLFVYKRPNDDATVNYRNQFQITISADGGSTNTKTYFTKGLNTTGWGLLIWTFISNTLKVYWNSTELTVANNTLIKVIDAGVFSIYNNTADNLKIGAINTTPTFYAKGLLDYGVVVNKQLSAGEIVEYYNRKPSSFPVASDFSFSSNIVSLWKIGESPDSWGISGGIKDSVGSNHGTMWGFDPSGSFSTDVAA